MKQLSTFLGINIFDIVKGAATAAFTAIAAAVMATFNSGAFPTGVELKKALAYGAAAFVGYIIKQFFTNSQGDLLKKDQTVPAAPKQ